MQSHIFLTIIALMVSAASALWLIPFVIKWHKRKILLIDDMNKRDKRKIPGLGGISLVLSFFFATAAILAIKMFLGIDGVNLTILLPGLLSIFIMAFVGFVDDVLMFPIRPIKPILALLASLPMMTIIYNQDTIFNIPFIGEINLFLIYPLIIIPFIIVFTSNAINIMADFDGLTPANGLIISIALFICAFLSNQPTSMVVFAAIAGALLVFLFFNKYPAKIFTGNVGTLFLGSVFAIGAILGNLKYSLLILMIPYLIHFILQQRITWDRKSIKVRPRERGIILKNGILKSEYSKAYGFTHLIMQRLKNITEKRLVIYLSISEIFCAICAVLFHIINIKK